MFIHLYETIYPFLFEFFSKLVGVANISILDLQSAIKYNSGIPYTDLLTGVQHNMYLFLNDISQDMLTLFIDIITFNVPSSAPLWVALILACVNGFIVISILKFFFGIFS